MDGDEVEGAWDEKVGNGKLCVWRQSLDLNSGL